MRAVETAFAVVLVWVLYSLLWGGALESLREDFGGWYSSKVENIFAFSVVDTTTKLPQLERSSLPLLPGETSDGVVFSKFDPEP